nr:type II toxin-antitoxin system RelE/ParE family toxin [uncultured Halomonas sp.]
MIESFACKHTRQLFIGAACPQRFRAIQHQAERKLQLIDSAATLDFLRSPPGNRLEILKGGRQGQYSIRINDRWRICFRFESGAALDVEIVDYH